MRFEEAERRVHRLRRTGGVTEQPGRHVVDAEDRGPSVGGEDPLDHPAGLPGGHLQTIAPTLAHHRFETVYARERIDTPDGDFLDLDWARRGARRLAILSHGLEGSSQRWYILSMAEELGRAGWDVVAWNFRGCSGEPNRALRFYHSGATDDLAVVIDHAMRAGGYNVGGEQSGHIILADHATTGDGLVAGLQVLAALVEGGVPASGLLRQFEPLPQLLKNVRFNGGAEPLETDSVRKRIAAAEAELEGRGRLVIRKSGTEPLIRVMAEGDDPALVERVVDDICEAVQASA